MKSTHNDITVESLLKGDEKQERLHLLTHICEIKQEWKSTYVHIHCWSLCLHQQTLALFYFSNVQ